jgi:hypothetical protein
MQAFVRYSRPLLAVAGLITATISVSAFDDRDDSSQAKQIRKGFEIAPVPLNMQGKQPALVGLGSYLVNTTGNCNDCHTSSPANEYASGGTPWFGQYPKRVNPAAYLLGGRNFAAFPFVSRNLTPDKKGEPAGLTLPEFMNVMKTGKDPDTWHPTCTPTTTSHCVAPPTDGSLLQIMPWPKYQDLTDRELIAIYAYLSAIPCLEGDPGNPAGTDTQGHRCQ